MSEQTVKKTSPSEQMPQEIPLLRGRIVSGMPLPIAARKRIIQRFETMLNCHVRMTCRIDKKLIAGVRVELDGRSYDGTLQGQLDDVRKMLTRHEDEEEL